MNGALTAMVNVARVGLGWELPVLIVFCCCLFVVLCIFMISTSQVLTGRATGRLVHQVSEPFQFRYRFEHRLGGGGGEGDPEGGRWGGGGGGGGGGGRGSGGREMGRGGASTEPCHCESALQL